MEKESQEQKRVEEKEENITEREREERGRGKKKRERRERSILILEQELQRSKPLTEIWDSLGSEIADSICSSSPLPHSPSLRSPRLISTSD